MTARCPICDRPLATDADTEHPTDCAHCYQLCWGVRTMSHCDGDPVDWRARALTAEARLAELLDEQSRRLHDAFERRTQGMEQMTGDDARKVIR